MTKVKFIATSQTPSEVILALLRAAAVDEIFWATKRDLCSRLPVTFPRSVAEMFSHDRFVRALWPLLLDGKVVSKYGDRRLVLVRLTTAAEQEAHCALPEMM